MLFSHSVPEHRNILLAIVISSLILAFYQFFFPPIQIKNITPQTETSEQISIEDTPNPDLAFTKVPEKNRVLIHSDRVRGYVNLKGARIDELELTQYPETTQKNSPPVKLIQPKASSNEYFANSGFLGVDDAPNSQTLWKLSSDNKLLTPKQNITMHWENSNGIQFQRTISMVDPYLFSIKDTVINGSLESTKLVPYGRIFRRLTAEPEDFFIFHEGFIENLDEGVEQIDYSDLDSSQVRENPQRSNTWIGNTDKYWMTLLYPTSDAKAVRFSSLSNQSAYQGDYQLEELNLKKGEQVTFEHLFFAGPKINGILKKYENKYNIENMSYSIDWGWFAPITKIASWFLLELNSIFQNFGVSIIMLTIIVRIMIFPLMFKSTKNSKKMKVLAPEMQRMRKLYAGNREAMAAQIGKLYKKHDISILSMILPILIQIPIFFSLYKVLLISIHMRHAPFLYWIQDLSSKDPTNIFTLFGIIPWNPPSFLHVGIWPILVGISFYLQQKFGQATAMHNTNSTLGEAFAKTMKILPFMMAFILAGFPAGLMIYWSTTNLLGITQHQIISKFMLSKKEGK